MAVKEGKVMIIIIMQKILCWVPAPDNFVKALVRLHTNCYGGQKSTWLFNDKNTRNSLKIPIMEIHNVTLYL